MKKKYIKLIDTYAYKFIYVKIYYNFNFIYLVKRK